MTFPVQEFHRTSGQNACSTDLAVPRGLVMKPHGKWKRNSKVPGAPGCRALVAPKEMTEALCPEPATKLSLPLLFLNKVVMEKQFLQNLRTIKNARCALAHVVWKEMQS